MKTLYMDSRGNLAALFKQYMIVHPRKTKNYRLISVNNQAEINKFLPKGRMKWDLLVVENKRVQAMFELKHGGDLDSSLKTKRLSHELNEYTADAKKFRCNNLYLICGGVYQPKIYAWLNSVMNNQFPWIRFYMPMSTEKMIKKCFDLIEKPITIKKELIPTLIRTSDKSFANSITANNLGVSDGLGHSLSLIWHRDIGEGDIQKCCNDYYNDGKIYGELANKIYTKWCETWNRTIVISDDEIEEKIRNMI